jgi:hypothetical protein
MATFNENDSKIVTRAAPKWAWDILDETLLCDMESSAFDRDLKDQIAQAFEAMRRNSPNMAA